MGMKSILRVSLVEVVSNNFSFPQKGMIVFNSLSKKETIVQSSFGSSLVTTLYFFDPF